MNKGMGYAALCALIFVTLEPVSKLLGGQLDPMLVTGVRFAIGGLVLLPGALKKSRKIGLRLGGRDLAQLGLLGVLVICVSMVLLQIAIELSDAPAMIAIIFSSNSVMLLLLAALVLRERLSARRWAAVGLCAAGVLCGTQLSAGAGTASVLLAAAAAATFSLYALLSKKLAARIPSAVQMSLSYLIGSAVLLLWLCGTNLGAFSEIEVRHLPILLYLGVVVTGLGYFFYFRAMEVSAFYASMSFFLKPAIAPFAAFWINGIAPSTQIFVALALVMGGSLLCITEPKTPIQQK